MQLHFSPATSPDDEYKIQVCNSDLVTIDIGPIELYVTGREDADRLIRALERGKEGMDARAKQDAAGRLAERGEHPYPVPSVMAGQCAVQIPAGGGHVWICSLKPHAKDGRHEAHGFGPHPLAVWFDGDEAASEVCGARPYPTGSEGDDGLTAEWKRAITERRSAS